MSSGKKQRISEYQKKLLKDLMVANPTFAREGICSGPSGALDAKKYWEKIRDSLNASGAAQKTVAGWRQTWNDLKGRIKAKAAELTNVPTGNGRDNKDVPQPMTEYEAVIYGLLGGKEWSGATIEEEIGATHLIESVQSVDVRESLTEANDQPLDEALHLPGTSTEQLRIVPTLAVRQDHDYSLYTVLATGEAPSIEIKKATTKKRGRLTENDPDSEETRNPTKKTFTGSNKKELELRELAGQIQSATERNAAAVEKLAEVINRQSDAINQLGNAICDLSGAVRSLTGAMYLKE